MKDTAQHHEPAPSSAVAQRESQESSGHLSAQLAGSPRQLAQRHLIGRTLGGAVQRVENRTGLPDGLKAGIESLSGMDMSDVRVHRNSSQPAQLNALAYAQGNDIHLGPGQEQHLPHEAWHVVQQRQGRVQATMQMAGVGVGVNDDEGLETEADVMGGRAVQSARNQNTALLRGGAEVGVHGTLRQAAQRRRPGETFAPPANAAPVQRVLGEKLAGINETYLKDFSDRFAALKMYKNRQLVLQALRDLPEALNTREDLGSALRPVLLTLNLPVPAEDTEPIALPRPLVADKVVRDKPGDDEPPRMSLPLDQPAVLSVSPAQNLVSQRVAPDRRAEVLNISAQSTVMELYASGMLLVTAVQRKDIAKMHREAATAGVSDHVGLSKINMARDDANRGRPLEYAKVNWTMTSPHMRPHYFGMILGKDDRSPKPEPENEGDVNAPRIATLANPAAMGSRFMKGKSGKADFSEWHQDQSSSKAAGVNPDEPLFNFSDTAVKERLISIRDEQERDYLETNPEINTFGFPPDAIVGFLVASNDERNLAAIRAAKLGMSATQQLRSFPVYTWRKDGAAERQRWTLVQVATL